MKPKSKLILALVGLSVLVSFFYAEEDWRGWHAWQTFKQEEEAKSEKFDLASFVPKPVPDDQNFALTPIVASCYARYLDNRGHRIRPENTNVVNRLEMKIGAIKDTWEGNTNTLGDWRKAARTNLKGWQAYYRTPPVTNYYSAGTNEFPMTPNPQLPAADVLLALSKYDSAVEELRQAANQRPCSRFPLNYDSAAPKEILLPHLYAFEDCAQVLQLRAVAESADNQTAKALADVELVLRLSDSIRDEPGFYSQLVRLELAGLSIQPIWEGLAEHKWSDGQLAKFEQSLVKLNVVAGYPFAIRSERALNLAAVEFMRRNRSRAWDCIPVITYLGRGNSYEPPDGMDYAHPFMQTLTASMVPSGWFYQSEMTIGRIYQPSLPSSNGNGMELVSSAAHRAGKMLENERRHVSPYNAVAIMICPYFGRLAERFVFTQSSLDLARVACTLERYHIAQGEYPGTLDELAPQIIKNIPHDTINGQPLHYRRTNDGQFVLYSVGWNETDDGGVVVMTQGSSSFIDWNKGDWVWHYPAK